jgi:hypothetical protein
LTLSSGGIYSSSCKTIDGSSAGESLAKRAAVEVCTVLAQSILDFATVMDRVCREGQPSEALYVPHFNGSTPSHAGFVWGNGLENSSDHARRWFRVDGQRYGASPADTVEKRHGTGTPDAVEERHRTSSTDTVEWNGSGSANTLVRVASQRFS